MTPNPAYLHYFPCLQLQLIVFSLFSLTWLRKKPAVEVPAVEEGGFWRGGWGDEIFRVRKWEPGLRGQLQSSRMHAEWQLWAVGHSFQGYSGGAGVTRKPSGAIELPGGRAWLTSEAEGEAGRGLGKAIFTGVLSNWAPPPCHPLGINSSMANSLKLALAPSSLPSSMI